MAMRAMRVIPTSPLVVVLSCVAFSLIAVADGVTEKKRPNVADEELFFAPVPKAVCGPGDTPETGLQGQVPASVRMQPGGFQGFSCNLKMMAQVKGEGSSWSADEMREGRSVVGRLSSRKACAYHPTAAPESSANQPGRTNFGTRVIDISDPAKPVLTDYLTTRAMLFPHESLKVNERRKLLGAVRGDSGVAPADRVPNDAPAAYFDVYDVSGDCRHPQLLSSAPMVYPPDPLPIRGHEGSWAPDGLTYYASDLAYFPPGATSTGQYYAIDATDTTNPKVIATWQKGIVGGFPHGLSVSDDGNRGYFTSVGSTTITTLLDPAAPANNGLIIYDLSEIRARRENPQVKIMGTVFWKDGSAAQHTIPIQIKGKPYVIFADEGGSPGARNLGCPEGFAIWGIARIIDISDETKPKVVSKLMLEVSDPKNCDITATDGPGSYSSHYCSVDNRQRATTLACGYMSSGIRVFDIRDPIRPREIAYYNPPGVAEQSPGAAIWNGAGGPDWCTNQVLLDAQLGTLWTTCFNNGLLSLKFTHNAWPFGESRTPPGKQN